MKAWGGGTGSIALSTSAVDGDGWPNPRAAFITPEKDSRYPPIVQETGWDSGRYGQLRKTPPLLVFEPREAQTIASCYTEYAVAAAKMCVQPTLRGVM